MHRILRFTLNHISYTGKLGVDVIASLMLQPPMQVVIEFRWTHSAVVYYQANCTNLLSESKLILEMNALNNYYIGHSLKLRLHLWAIFHIPIQINVVIRFQWKLTVVVLQLV